MQHSSGDPARALPVSQIQQAGTSGSHQHRPEQNESGVDKTRHPFPPRRMTSPAVCPSNKTPETRSKNGVSKWRIQ